MASALAAIECAIRLDFDQGDVLGADMLGGIDPDRGMGCRDQLNGSLSNSKRIPVT
jgi:hypothetical protein